MVELSKKEMKGEYGKHKEEFQTLLVKSLLVINNKWFMFFSFL